MTCEEELREAREREARQDGLGVRLISVERDRQVRSEGYDARHDAGHSEELALAGATYALTADMRIIGRDDTPITWPWDSPYWKPTPGNRLRDLVKAGALIAAAIDSLALALADSRPEERT